MTTTAAPAAAESTTGTRVITYSEAIREAIGQAMEADDRVFMLGEDIGIYGGAFGVSGDLYHRFGADRVRDTPISELGIVGAAVGAAMVGSRPIVEIQFSDFTCQAMDQIVNQAAKIHFMLGGAASVPMVLRAPGGSGTGAAAQHSQSLEAWFAHVPGLKVVMPATPADAKGLLLSAIDDPNPVIVIEHKLLYRTSGEVPTAAVRTPLGKAAVRRRGDDITLIATGIMVSRSLEAADALAEQGVEATVVDVRSLVPFDAETVLDTVKNTGRVLLVQEAVKSGGFMSEVAARISESDAIYSLLAPIGRVCGLDVPIPYAPQLERAAVPQVEDIINRGLNLDEEFLMANEIPLPMPKMSMTMETGEMISWSVAAGDTVKSGDVLAEVQTDKVDMEVESPVDGVIARLVAQPGDVVDVGAPIAFILSESDDLMAGLFDPPPDGASEPATPGSDVAPAGPDRNGSARGPKAATPVSRKGPLPAVPKARRRAAELNVSLEDVRATGPGGVITVEDVELVGGGSNGAAAAPAAPAPAPAAAPAAAAAPAPAAARPAPAPVAPARPAAAPAASADDPGFADALAPRRKAIRSAIARTMTASASIPQFTVFTELDLEAASRVRGRIGWTTLLMRGLARAIRQYPQVNAGWDDAANAPAAPKDTVGVALAADTAIGLLAPVIRDPDLLPIEEQDALIRATIARARTGKLTGPDLQGGTTTLSNLGGFGVPSFTSLLTPPQATALSAGAISERPMVVRGGLTARLGVTVGLTIDHRPIDGADGARVLADLREMFLNPERLLD